FHGEKNRMIANDVVRVAILDAIAPRALCRAGHTVMNELKIGKRESGPTAHVRFDLINCIPTEAGEHSAQRIPTLTTINFRGSAHVKIRAFLEKEAVTYLVVNGTAPDSEARIPAEVFKTFFKVLTGESKVSVEIYQKF